ncbi:MAG: DUF4214 domain-containing protein [Actinomycetota bacterium]
MTRIMRFASLLLFGLLVVSVVVLTPSSPMAAADGPTAPYLCPNGGPNAQSVPRLGIGSGSAEFVDGSELICSDEPDPCQFGAVTVGTGSNRSIRCMRTFSTFCPSQWGGWHREGTAPTFDGDGNLIGSNNWLATPAVLPPPEPAQTGSVLELSMLPEFTEADADMLRLYAAFFERDPELAGAQYWYGQSKAGVSLDTVAWSFSQSAEFLARYGETTSEQFLTIVYQNVLGRGPDQEGLDYWLGQIANGLDRSGAVRWIAASQEFKNSNPIPDLAAFNSQGYAAGGFCA